MSQEQTEPQTLSPVPPRAATGADRGRASFAYRLLYPVLTWLLHHLFEVQVIGGEFLPKGNYIVAANHVNWLDPFILLHVLPKEPRVYFIGRRSEVYKTWIRRFMLWLADGIIPVEPGTGRASGAERALRDALAVLAGGGSLGIFPEGRIGQEGQLAPFRGGVGFLAARSGLPVVPVALSGTKDLYHRKKISVVVGEPMHLAAGARMGSRDEEFVRNLQQTIGALLPPYQEEPEGHRRLRFLSKLM